MDITCKQCLRWRKDFVNNLKEFANTYRQSINEELSDERVLAHIHTCINKWDDFIDEAVKEELKK